MGGLGAGAADSPMPSPEGTMLAKARMVVEHVPMIDDLVSLTYRSRVCLADPVADIVAIVQASRVRNPRLGITGILLYNGFHFVQTLEGPRTACNHLLERISKDPRHLEIVAFGLRPIEQRSFPDWSMQLISRAELRAIMPELKLLDLKEPEDIERLHRRIIASLSARPSAPDDGA
ncbi:BLUF domain-containing protein [Rhodobacter sp. NSM]|uniref:BLUF domain-containing protein n=1 Tax=Rhodobacter sp. NSM TaxID=3457501 RepID=UPI003FD5DC01